MTPAFVNELEHNACRIVPGYVKELGTVCELSSAITRPGTLQLTVLIKAFWLIKFLERSKEDT